MTKTKEQIKKHFEKLREKRDSTLSTAISKVKDQARPDCWCTTHANCFQFSIGKSESESHIRAKFERFLNLRMIGYTVFTELRWKGKGGRSDLVVCANNGDVWIEEILESETDKKFEQKLDKYPFPVNKIYAKDCYKEI